MRSQLLRSRLLTLLLAAPLLFTIPDRRFDHQFDRQWNRSLDPKLDQKLDRPIVRLSGSGHHAVVPGAAGRPAASAARDSFCVAIPPSHQTIMQSGGQTGQSSDRVIVLSPPRQTPSSQTSPSQTSPSQTSPSQTGIDRWLCISSQPPSDLPNYLAMGRSVLGRIARIAAGVADWSTRVRG